MREALSHAIRNARMRGRLGVIAELKRRRPGGVDLLRGRDVADIARVYQAAGATALSVVTSPWFGGSLDMLERVAQTNLGLPILRKDSIRTEESVRASRRAGASAVLLVLPLLGLERLAAMLQATHDEGLEPFVEVATREEIDQVRSLYPGVIAINNADIKTNEFEGEDVSRSVALIDRQDPRLWISASRIRGPADVAVLAAAGFDGILIGTHLLLADDLKSETERVVAAARCQSQASTRPIVKVCGVTHEEEIDHLAECGVNFFGLQVDVPSPWAIPLTRASELAARARGATRATLVTRSDRSDNLTRLIRETGVKAIQLGLLATPRHVEQLRGAFASDELTIIQEIPFSRGKFWNEERIDDYRVAGSDYILLDKLEKSVHDATAPATIPEQALASFRQRHANVPILVAGGVAPENVAALVRASGAMGIDVCSSVRREGLIRRDLVERLIERIPHGSKADPSQPRRRSLREFLTAAPAGNQVIAYLTLGDPPDRFGALVDDLLAAGALTLELGFPYAKPLEGATLAASHQRALSAGIDTSAALTMFRSAALRHPTTPLIAVVQWPAISDDHAAGLFLDQLVEAAAAAVLPVGIPQWRLPAFAEKADARGLQTVLACAPNASAKSRAITLRYCTGALYVPRARLTGSAAPVAGIAEFCQLVAGEMELPIIVGVGVKTAADVAEICRTPAKAAAVGSALVEHVIAGGNAGDYVRQLMSD